MTRSAIRVFCFVILGLAFVALMDGADYLPRSASSIVSARSRGFLQQGRQRSSATVKPGSSPGDAQDAATKPASQPGQTKVTQFQARPSPPTPNATGASITPIEESGQIDMGKLDIHPLPAPLTSRRPSRDLSPLVAAVGRGSAFMSVSTNIVNQNTANAFSTVSSNWIPGESVQYYISGSLAGTFTADGSGRIAVLISTNAGFGYITIDNIGLTSMRETGGVVQVAPTGPYLPGVAVAPHAINTAAGGTIYLHGPGYPPNSMVNLYRNGSSIGTTMTNGNGRFFVIVTPANNGNTSAVYSADNGTAGSMAGQTVEERSDAGTPPAGDQNNARAFVDRAVINSTVGTIFSLIGELHVGGSFRCCRITSVKPVVSFFSAASVSSGKML